MRKATVALSIHFDEGSNIWNNGLIQNLAFLVRTLQSVPEVGQICLVNSGNAQALPAGLDHEWLNVPIVKPEAITHTVDLVLEVGLSLPVEWLRHVKALGAKVAAFLVGHTYPGQAEAAIFDRPGGMVLIGTPWDETWLLEQHMKTSGSLLRTVTRAPVVPMPHLWSSAFIDVSAERMQKLGKPFGFRPAVPEARRPWRVAIFEPNNTVTKTSFIPMLVCDAAYRSNQESVGHMMVMNTVHMKDHATFNRFALSLDLTKDQKATYEPRLAFAECMANYDMDAVVAHQWENSQNYAYYDALHGGYPLIHNSPVLQRHGMGFYYPGFEAIKGGQALLEAWQQPPDYWTDYRRRSADYLATLHPDHPDNIRIFRDRILHLLGARLEQA